MSHISDTTERAQRQLINDELFRITGYHLSNPTSPTVSTEFSANISSSVVCATTVESLTTTLEVMCQVQCKLTHRFCSHWENAFEVVIGSIVIISGDGNDSFDVGVVVKIYSLEQYDAKMSSKRPSNDKEESEIRKLLRLATPQECLLLPSKHAEEEQLLAECQAIVAIQHLPMIVYGADFQMDGGKDVSFAFSSSQVNCQLLEKAGHCAIMRRKVGVSAVKKRQEDNDQFSKVGKDLEESKLSKVQEVLTNFKNTLSEFAAKHKEKIISDPEFRQQFHTMCVSVGVDPLASSKGFWADMLGVGDFYFELGVKIIEISVKTRSSNGGIMSLKELIKHLNRTSKVELSVEDIQRAVEKLSVLGNGFRIIEIAGSSMICSVPLEINTDHEKLFSAAQFNQDYVTLEQMTSMFGWTEERFNQIINPLLSEGMVWIDDHEGVTYFCFPSLWNRV